MSLVIETWTVDCTDPRKVAEFWAQMLGWTIDEAESDDEEVLLNPPASGPSQILFIRVPEAKTIKNRTHLDLRPDDQEAEVARALSLGAKPVDIGQNEQPWVVLADIEGNEFCILRSRQPAEADA
jgi:predicted enzyme related to lactoylglutathione lyase